MMKLLRRRLYVIAVCLSPNLALAQSSGPEDRQITDPHSIVSVSAQKTRPVPLEDLYFARKISDASWSPNGNEIVFTANMSGRLNLWKVSSEGGWPEQLIVLQGVNDPNVPREEADQAVSLLKKDGKTVDAYFYPDEGHSLEKRENQIDSTRRTLDWFEKYLKARP